MQINQKGNQKYVFSELLFVLANNEVKNGDKFIDTSDEDRVLVVRKSPSGDIASLHWEDSGKYAVMSINQKFIKDRVWIHEKSNRFKEDDYITDGTVVWKIHSFCKSPNEAFVTVDDSPVSGQVCINGFRLATPEEVEMAKAKVEWGKFGRNPYELHVGDFIELDGDVFCVGIEGETYYHFIKANSEIYFSVNKISNNPCIIKRVKLLAVGDRYDKTTN